MIHQDRNVVSRKSSTVIQGVDNYAGSGLSVSIFGKKNRVHGRDSSGVAVWGEDNIIQAAASGVVIHGYQNTVGFGCKNIFIQGKNNILSPLLSNVSMINTDNQTVTESDVTYINNEKIKKSNNFCAEYCTDWFSTNSKTLFSSPLDVPGLAAPGAGLVLIPKFILFAMDAGTPFDYADSLTLAYSTAINSGVPIVSFVILNQGTDKYFIANVDAFDFVANDKMQLKVLTQDATVGNSIIYIKVIYSIETAPF